MATGPLPERKIIHVDMDAFYASVEQRDRPELRGKPIVVGGPPQSRGVVCTASYEARKFGVHSAMPCSQAARLCPEAIFVPPDFPRYVAVSEHLREIFRRHSDLIEPLSLDEAYLDVTTNKRGLPSATAVAREIRREIQFELSLTASAGVAPNKFLAKVASDHKKPDGLTVITPSRMAAFLEKLPIRKLPGVGPVTEESCRKFGLVTCRDVLAQSPATLERWLGSLGPHLHDLAQGIDPRPVITDWIRKSSGIEDTFAVDLHTLDEAIAALATLAEGLARRLERDDSRGRTLTLKVKYSDFTQITRRRKLPVATRHAGVLLQVARELLADTEVGRRPIRLLGISMSQLDGDDEYRQLHFPWVESLLGAGSDHGLGLLPRADDPTS